MKNINILKIITLFTLFIMASCDNEPIDPVLANQLNTNNNNNNNNGGGGGTTSGVFKADFSGQTWTADAYEAVIYNGQIQIAGSKGTQGEGFGFILNGTVPGTYASTSNLLAFVPANSQEQYIGFDFANPTNNVGNVVVTNIDTVNHKMSGTFNFTGYWSDTSVTNVLPIVFSNGVFTDIPYTTGNPSTDTFYAKVDGVEFVENNIDVAYTQSSGFPDSISIVASKSNGDNVGLSIAQSLPVGTYQFAGPFGTQINSTALFSGTLFNGDTGSLTIVSKTATRISGTFTLVTKNFTTNATKSITEGSFDVELP
jgi:hypothetical protein